jgi:hypothetical protein
LTSRRSINTRKQPRAIRRIRGNQAKDTIFIKSNKLNIHILLLGQKSPPSRPTKGTSNQEEKPSQTTKIESEKMGPWFQKEKEDHACDA